MIDIIICIIEKIPWAEFGIAGAALGILAFLLLKQLSKKNVEYSFFKEFLGEIEKRETKLISIQEKTIEALNCNSNALEKISDRMEALEEKSDGKQ